VGISAVRENVAPAERKQQRSKLTKRQRGRNLLEAVRVRRDAMTNFTVT